MDRDIYQAPESDLVRDGENSQPFYVVSSGKFLLLYLATLGLYGLYWFYCHWQSYRRYSGTVLWPVPRAIFSIFFAHSLFRRFYGLARKENPELHWSHGTYATLYVVFILFSNLADRLTAFGLEFFLASLLGIGAFLVVTWVLWHAQGVANMACKDPAGAGNRQITLANIAWIILGLALWLLMIAGIVISLFGPAIYEQG